MKVWFWRLLEVFRREERAVHIGGLVGLIADTSGVDYGREEKRKMSSAREILRDRKQKGGKGDTGLKRRGVEEVMQFEKRIKLKEPLAPSHTQRPQHSLLTPLLFSSSPLRLFLRSATSDVKVEFCRCSSNSWSVQ